MDKIAVTSDPLSTSHQIAIAPQYEVGEVVNPSMNYQILPPHLLWISAQIWLATLLVVTMSHFLNLTPLIQLIL